MQGTEPRWPKMGELGPHWLQSNKISDSINYHFIKHAWVRMSTFRKKMTLITALTIWRHQTRILSCRPHSKMLPD